MGRAPCCDKANVKRGPWSPEEDATLINYLEKNGTGGNWISLPQKAGLKRCGKSCRLRWLNYLRPDIKHGGFTEEEDKIIFSLYKSLGSRWSVIASKLQGRTDNDVKNYWNTKLKKKFFGKPIHQSAINNSNMATTSNSTQHIQLSSLSDHVNNSSYGLSNQNYSSTLPFAQVHGQDEGIVKTEQPIHHFPLPRLMEPSEFDYNIVSSSATSHQQEVSGSGVVPLLTTSSTSSIGFSDNYMSYSGGNNNDLSATTTTVESYDDGFLMGFGLNYPYSSYDFLQDFSSNFHEKTSEEEVVASNSTNGNSAFYASFTSSVTN
ncbi:hypothetical protein C5167_031741 [Papaver somniferum]|uniref:Uncharacterized protein n=1 Tax=Papaver somniferum TaxID=3469 RepID=A0A4Y7K530_PAPSO|nr:transcription factor MYB87-like [Papaver somniferum]RZC68463.1 hypothetical protein C5167_031741 [Papaver somniferum]